MTFKDTIRLCERCNKEYTPNQHNQKFCVGSCGIVSLKNLIVTCAICDSEFKPNNSNQKACSDKCKKIQKNKSWNNFYRKQKGYEPNKEIKCIVCDNIFKRVSIDQKICKDKDCKLKYLRKKGLEGYYKNKEKILERRRNNINFCILNKLRMRISCAVKSQGTYKADKTINLIGCSVIELKKYLEEKFEDGMNWKNYGKNGWHIDHINPCSNFDLTNNEEQKKCFNYINLQPLWATTEIAKFYGSNSIGNLNKSSKCALNEN